MAIRLVILDCDGTLWHTPSPRKILNPQKTTIPQADIETTDANATPHKSSLRLALDNCVLMKMKQDSDSILARILEQKIKQIKSLFSQGDYSKRFVASDPAKSPYKISNHISHTNFSPLFDGCKQMLNDLKARNYQLGLFTSEECQTVHKKLHNLNFTNYFDHVRCIDDGPSKPDPMMINSIIDTAGVASYETVMIGDSLLDMLAAERAQCWAIEAQWNKTQFMPYDHISTSSTPSSSSFGYGHNSRNYLSDIDNPIGMKRQAKQPIDILPIINSIEETISQQSL